MSARPGIRPTAGGAVARAAAVLGHELRNPLASALTGTALVQAMVDDGDPRRPILDGVLRDLERLAGLLDGYLGFVRTGRPRRVPLRMAALCTAIAGDRTGVTVAAATPGEVWGDETLLSRVLENLVDNALQSGAGAVSLTVASTADRVVVTVRDDGPGVPAAIRGELFEPGCSGRGSAGLGLSIVAEAVAAHGGEVRCEPVEHGACFVVSLPVRAEERQGERQGERHQIGQPRQQAAFA